MVRGPTSSGESVLFGRVVCARDGRLAFGVSVGLIHNAFPMQFARWPCSFIQDAMSASASILVEPSTHPSSVTLPRKSGQFSLDPTHSAVAATDSGAVCMLRIACTPETQSRGVSELVAQYE